MLVNKSNYLSYATHIKNLNSLYNSELKNSPADKLISKFYNFFILSFSESRKNEAYRTQEHLIKGNGSHLRTQLRAYTTHFASRKGGKFDQLNRELKKGKLSEFSFLIRFFLPWGKKLWAHQMKSELHSLKPGQSLWIGANSFKAHHAMIMRCTKNAVDSYTLEFANTGCGLHNNPDFHPRKRAIDEPNYYQLVGIIKDIPASKLQKDFFYTFVHIADKGKIPKKSSFKTAIENDIKTSFPLRTSLNKSTRVVNTMYAALRCLGIPQRAKDLRYYETPQIGSSCSASSLKAMIRVVLDPEEFHEADIDMKMKALVHHYKKIKKGFDQSSTRKIMALDLIQKLKEEIKDPILTSIEKELKNNLKMLDAEVKITSSSKKINHFIDSQGILSPFTVNLSAKNTKSLNPTLKAHASFKKTRKPFHYRVTHKRGRWEGVSCVDKTALLVFFAARGNHKKTKFYLESLLKDLNEAKPKIQERAVTLHTIHLLDNLAKNFTEFDTTYSGIAKRKFLSLLAFKELCMANNIRENLPLKEIRNQLTKEEQPLFDSIMNTYARAHRQFQDLQVNRILSDENIWKSALEKLQT